MCCDDSVMWGALAVALMCCVQGGKKKAASVTGAGADADADADDEADAEDWVAESIARAQHCFATAHKLDPKNADNLCNFAVFSAEIACDVSRAKGAVFHLALRQSSLKLSPELFASALKCDANHAETLLNFANFLDGQGEHEQGGLFFFETTLRLLKRNSDAAFALRCCCSHTARTNEW
jgi:hypothetical protein